jgi:hypothetical protein
VRGAVILEDCRDPEVDELRRAVMMLTLKQSRPQ